MTEWFGFKKEKLILPDFEVSKERDALVEEYAKLQRNSVAFALDREGFTDEEVDRVKKRMQELEDELREYLRPYAGFEQIPKQATEYLRWDVAQSIYRKGRYKSHSWEHWDRAESERRKSDT